MAYLSSGKKKISDSGSVGNVSDLETTAKDTLVSAINEIKEGLDNIDIDNCVT